MQIAFQMMKSKYIFTFRLIYWNANRISSHPYPYNLSLLFTHITCNIILIEKFERSRAQCLDFYKNPLILDIFCGTETKIFYTLRIQRTLMSTHNLYFVIIFTRTWRTATILTVLYLRNYYCIVFQNHHLQSITGINA